MTLTQKMIDNWASKDFKIGEMERLLTERLTHHGVKVDYQLIGGWDGKMLYTITTDKFTWQEYDHLAFLLAMITTLETVLLEKKES